MDLFYNHTCCGGSLLFPPSLLSPTPTPGLAPWVCAQHMNPIPYQTSTISTNWQGSFNLHPSETHPPKVCLDSGALLSLVTQLLRKSSPQIWAQGLAAAPRPQHKKFILYHPMQTDHLSLTQPSPQLFHYLLDPCNHIPLS